MRLTINMHVDPLELNFSNYLLSVGEGREQTYPHVAEDIIKIKNDFLVPCTSDLIGEVFPSIEIDFQDKYYAAHRAILTPKNSDVDMLNKKIMRLFPGNGIEYKSADSVCEEDLVHAYPTEFLNSLTPSGMPPHSMMLKVGAPVMLLRNLRAGGGYGLRNRTRLILLKLGSKVLEAEIATRVNRGRTVLIPRITMALSDTELPFTLRRRQFPIQPCFCMTTNKAQGQTLDFVDVYLPEDVFTHGQLYVALCRVCNSSSVAVFVNSSDGYTRNIVYPEVLQN